MTDIKLSINSKNFLKNIENSFTNKEIVLADLVQNARRAGASEIHFRTDNTTLRVRDNGSGVSDMKHLFNVTESSWKNNQESPFGFGFISTLFSCKNLCVVSGHFYISALTEDIKNGQSFSIKTVDHFVNGTEITMHDYYLSERQIKQHLYDIAQVSEIKVFYNQVELESKLQHTKLLAANYVAKNFEYGVIYFNPTLTESSCVYVHEYFKESVSPGGYRHALENKIMFEGCNIVKLCPKKVKARMPDRLDLLNEDDIYRAIQITTRETVKKLLKERLSSDDLDIVKTTVSKYKKLLTYNSYKALLNDVDYLPISYFIDLGEKFPTGEPIYLIFSDEVLSSNEISDLHIVDGLNYEESESFLPEMYAYLHGAYNLLIELDSDHWIYDQIVFLEEAKLHLEVNNHYKTATINHMTVTYCDSYSIGGPLGSIDDSYSSFSLGCGRGIVFPNDCNKGEVFKQINHLDYDEDNVDFIIEEGQQTLLESILLNQTDDVAKIIERAIKELPDSIMNKITDNIVSFTKDENGTLVVTKSPK
ncbi:ATP-binding protein [Photobacterium sp. GB-72]|uniref:ATP-binding protein n=1 Tax=Photobacterium sp. GB-72 TaxID=2022105 RepID=UPI001304F2CC|nr:ATP-binding protein [Photobacterium sp. GB-72]